MLLIGLTGNKYNGKSATASILCEKYNGVELAFADTLKKICSETYHVPLENFYDTNLKETVIPELGVTPRQLMQVIGMKFRAICEELPGITVKNPWIYNVEKQIQAFADVDQKENNLVIVSDVRFADEVAMIRKYNGIIVRVQRPSQDVPPRDEHISETSMNSFQPDYVMCNTSSIATLRLTADMMMHVFEKKNDEKKKKN